MKDYGKGDAVFWQKNRGWFGKQLESNMTALREGDVSRIPWIFCVFSENHDSSKLAAAKALHEALDTLTFTDIIRLDEQMRQTTSMEWSIQWHKLNMNSFFTPQMTEVERRAVILLASFNPNGFIREKAVQMMKDCDGTLQYIFLRLNDWVLQVRQAASEAFSCRLQNPSDGEIFAALPFADKLKRSVRGSHKEHISQFYAALATPENENILMKGLENENIRIRKICSDALFAMPCLNTKLAFERLTCEPDPFLRALIFNSLKNLGLKLDEIIDVFLSDKFPMNRMLAFQYLRDTCAGRLREITEKLLLDQNSTVREFAQNAKQKQSPGFDFRRFYLNTLDRHVATAICGLGEKGLPSDTAEIALYLVDSRIGVVKSAMTALMRLDCEKYSPVITEMLDDCRVGIVKTARNLILKYGHINYGRINEIFHASKFEYTRLRCMDILFTAPKWPHLVYILEAMFDSQKLFREKALEAIIRWLINFNSSFTLPNEAQMTEIQRLIDLLSGTIPFGIQNELLFTLSHLRFPTDAN